MVHLRWLGNEVVVLVEEEEAVQGDTMVIGRGGDLAAAVRRIGGDGNREISCCVCSQLLCFLLLGCLSDADSFI